MIKFPGQVLEATFLKRYKRFFADARLEDGTEITAHTPNTGSMLGLTTPGNPCIVSYNPSPKRKLQYSLQAISVDGAWVGCNTSFPNQLIFEAIADNLIPELVGYKTSKREVPYGLNNRSRIDIFLSDHPKKPNAFVEIKNVTLRQENSALFPDAVTSRGLKHLVELQDEVAKGNRAVMLFLVQRMDCQDFKPADHIDPTYGSELRKAQKAGVEILCLTSSISLEGLTLKAPLEIIL